MILSLSSQIFSQFLPHYQPTCLTLPSSIVPLSLSALFCPLAFLPQTCFHSTDNLLFFDLSPCLALRTLELRWVKVVLLVVHTVPSADVGRLPLLAGRASRSTFPSDASRRTIWRTLTEQRRESTRSDSDRSSWLARTTAKTSTLLLLLVSRPNS